MTKDMTAGEILGISGAYWKSMALQTGVVLDVFTVVEELGTAGTVSEDRLAERLGCDRRALAMFAAALVSLGFLERGADGLGLPAHSRRYLSRHSKEYLGHIITHHSHIAPAWCELARSVKTGRPARVSSSLTESESERESFLMGMFNVAVHQAETIAAALDLRGRKRLLDLGGGPGTYAVYFCLANPELRATVFDRPTSRTFAEGVVAAHGLTERVDFQGGDFLQSDLPGGYDAVWLSQVLHGESPEDAARLVRRAAGTLNPGGLLVVQEFVLDDDRDGPPHSALFGLNMLVGTDGGQTYTWREITDMMRAAGAVTVSRLDVALPQGCGILVGTVG